MDYDVSKSFAVWCLGASHHKKKLTKEQIIEVCNGLTMPIVLGGPNENKLASEILIQTNHSSLSNLCVVLYRLMNLLSWYKECSCDK